ncbi:MAG TPA: toll/interleukin-1 receptor domain-containing protein [Ktedonobacterales bacterium]|nr:toll/interleukin-1 receptor domain-containing protein [Ktedonobacterales bacterium]
MADSARVFISYSSKDTDIVNRLKAALVNAGVAVWLDHEQLTSGTPNWEAIVREGITQASHIVYVASPDAAASPFVIHEIEMARGNGKTVLPFWIRGENWYDCAPMGWYRA